MTERDVRARRTIDPRRRKQERLTRTIVVAGVLAATVGIALIGNRAASGHDNDAAAAGVAAPGVQAAVTSTTTGPSASDADGTVPDLAIAGSEEGLTADCKVQPKSISVQSSGADVQCLQQALHRVGYYTGPISGTFDDATSAAVKQFQIDKELFVDGIAGRVTNMTLGIWPDEQMFVVRTPPPPAGSKDSWGFPLSSVSSVGDNAPPLPENSGTGRRVVYERISQRVWAVAKDGTIIRSWLVSGSQYNNEVPGTYQVYSRSEQSTAWNGKAILPLMIRYYRTQIGAIGFHGIPIHVDTGKPYETEAELGTRLSGGCQRQANPDAAFMWAFADIGTKVVVL